METLLVSMSVSGSNIDKIRLHFEQLICIEHHFNTNMCHHANKFITISLQAEMKKNHYTRVLWEIIWL